MSSPTPRLTPPARTLTGFVRKLLATAAKAAAAEGEIVARLQSVAEGSVDPPLTRRVMGDAIWTPFRTAYHALTLALVPNRIDGWDLYQELVALVAAVAADHERLPSGPALSERAKAFVDRLSRPLVLFETGHAIEYLDLGTTTVNVGGVRLWTPDETTLRNWATGEFPFWDLLWAQKDRHLSVASYRVHAADPNRARIAAFPIIERALARARVATSFRQPGTADMSRFFWRATGDWVVFDADCPSSVLASGIHRPEWSPLVMPLGDACAQGIADLRLEALDNGSLNESLVRELDTALKWIDKSIVELDLEEQAIQLSTAMEVLLLPGYMGRSKGELMALRYHLLGGHLHPAEILADYTDRSDAIHHGVAKDVDWYRVWLFRQEVLVTLRLIVALATKNAAARSLVDLVPLYETGERLSQFIEYCDWGIWSKETIDPIRKKAEKRLRAIEGNGGGRT